jgi:hypothetical protein
MTDPVVADDGHTYQREAIEEWIHKCSAGTSTVYLRADGGWNQSLRTSALALYISLSRFQNTSSSGILYL